MRTAISSCLSVPYPGGTRFAVSPSATARWPACGAGAARSPDSYRALSEIKDGKAAAITAVARRYNLRRPSLWYITFYGLEPEARFSPMEVVISSGGREFRPVETIPLTPGFGEQRVSQREVQSALYVFEDAIDVSQPLTVAVEGARSAAWSEDMLRAIDRERALVRSRAGRVGKP